MKSIDLFYLKPLSPIEPEKICISCQPSQAGPQNDKPDENAWVHLREPRFLSIWFQGGQLSRPVQSYKVTQITALSLRRRCPPSHLDIPQVSHRPACFFFWETRRDPLFTLTCQLVGEVSNLKQKPAPTVISLGNSRGLSESGQTQFVMEQKVTRWQTEVCVVQHCSPFHKRLYTELTAGWLD